MTLHNFIVQIMTQPLDRIDFIDQAIIGLYWTGFVLGFAFIHTFITYSTADMNRCELLAWRASLWGALSFFSVMFAPISMFWLAYILIFTTVPESDYWPFYSRPKLSQISPAPNQPRATPK